MSGDESGFFDTQRAADYLGLLHRTLDGYRVSGNGPAFHRFGNRVRYPQVGSGRMGGEAPGHHDGGGGQAGRAIRAGAGARAACE